MIAAIVLAAGASSRYGTEPPKQVELLPQVLAALRAKAQGKDARFGPHSVPEVAWPEPLKVLTPAEGGDGKEMPRVAVHS